MLCEDVVMRHSCYVVRKTEKWEIRASRLPLQTPGFFRQVSNIYFLLCSCVPVTIPWTDELHSLI